MKDKEDPKNSYGPGDSERPVRRLTETACVEARDLRTNDDA